MDLAHGPGIPRKDLWQRQDEVVLPGSVHVIMDTVSLPEAEASYEPGWKGSHPKVCALHPQVCTGPRCVLHRQVCTGPRCVPSTLRCVCCITRCVLVLGVCPSPSGVCAASPGMHWAQVCVLHPQVCVLNPQVCALHSQESQLLPGQDSPYRTDVSTQWEGGPTGCDQV